MQPHKFKNSKPSHDLTSSTPPFLFKSSVNIHIDNESLLPHLINEYLYIMHVEFYSLAEGHGKQEEDT